MKLAAVAALVVIAFACAGCGSAQKGQRPTTSSPTAFRGLPTLRSGVAADFALVDQHGTSVRLSAQRGRVVLLTFLYTSCPDICPITAAKLGAAARLLGPLGPRLRILAVSVDPDNDTPRNVRRFIAKLHLPAEFHYLTGSRAQLFRVWQSYNVLVERRNLERVDHGVPIVAIDTRGRPRVYFSQTSTPTAIAHDVRLLLHPA
jgi:protein SCO1/2